MYRCLIRTCREYPLVNDPIMPWASGCKPYPTVCTCRRPMTQCRHLSLPLIRPRTYPHNRPNIVTPPQVDYNIVSLARYRGVTSDCVRLKHCTQSAYMDTILYSTIPHLLSVFTYVCTPSSHDLLSISSPPRTTRRCCEPPSNLSRSSFPPSPLY